MNNRSYQGRIYGKCASKANSRQLIFFSGKPKSIKSKDALQFVKDIKKQIGKKLFLEGDLKATFNIYYPSKRNDLDESLVMDGLEGLLYKNDRQIKKKIVEKFWDKEKPRVEFEIEEINWNESHRIQNNNRGKARGKHG